MIHRNVNLHFRSRIISFLGSLFHSLVGNNCFTWNPSLGTKGVVLHMTQNVGVWPQLWPLLRFQNGEASIGPSGQTKNRGVFYYVKHDKMSLFCFNKGLRLSENKTAANRHFIVCHGVSHRTFGFRTQSIETVIERSGTHKRKKRIEHKIERSVLELSMTRMKLNQCLKQSGRCEVLFLLLFRSLTLFLFEGYYIFSVKMSLLWLFTKDKGFSVHRTAASLNHLGNRVDYLIHRGKIVLNRSIYKKFRVSMMNASRMSEYLWS